MKKQHLPFLFAAALAAADLTAQAPIATDNLVVVRVGDGAAAINAATQAVFLDELTPAGVLVQSIALPTSTNGNQRQFTLRGNASSEGYLNVSPDGRWITLTGYDAAPLAPLSATEGSPALTTPRVVARIDRLTGQVDTSTALVDAYDGSATIQGNVRSAVTDDGNRFWLSGTGVTASAGVRFVASLGDSTSLQVGAGAPTNTRVVGIFDGQLYTTSASTVYLGVCTLGDGLPTGGGNLTTLLPGFPTTGGTAASSAYDYFFADANTLYVADDNTGTASVSGGISKWTLSGGTWTRQYRFRLNGPTATTGARGLTGTVRDGVATLWATANTSGQTTTTLITVTDTGPNSVVTALQTSATNTQWKGVRYVPKAPVQFPIPAACGTAQIAVYGNGEVGTELRARLRGTQGFPVIGVSLNPAGQTFCGCALVHDFAVMTFGGTTQLQLPNAPALFGLTLLYQGVDFLAPGGCPNPQFAVTDGVAVVVQ